MKGLTACLLILLALWIPLPAPSWASGTGTASPDVLRLRPGSLSAGAASVCGIRDDGSAICWGADSSGQVDTPPGPFVAVSTGGLDSSRNCGIRPSGGVQCWGANKTLAPPGTFTAISTGGYDESKHQGTGCGLLTSGRAECWTIHSTRTGAMQTVSLHPGRFTEVSAGAGFGCGVRVGGSVSCWGVHFTIPAPKGFMTRVQVWGRASPGGWPLNRSPRNVPFACGLMIDHRVDCWGEDTTGQLDAPSGAFNDLAVGAGFACGIAAASGRLECWGSGLRPPYPPKGRASEVAAGDAFVCELTRSRAVACYGNDLQAQTDVPGVPFKTTNPAAGSDCGVRVDDSVACWGDVSGPILNLPPGSFTTYSMDAGGDVSSCGLRPDETLRCWGTPAPPKGRFQAVAVNPDACAIAAATDLLRCWGRIARPPSGSYRAIAVGDGYAAGYACALNTQGHIKCWGDRRDVYDGRVNGQTSPPAGTYKQIAVMDEWACALTRSGVIRCRGNREFVPPGRFRHIALGWDGGQLRWGLCGITMRGSLLCASEAGVRRLPGGPYLSVAGGYGDICALDAHGGVRCWGGTRIRIPQAAAPSDA